MSDDGMHSAWGGDRDGAGKDRPVGPWRECEITLQWRLHRDEPGHEAYCLAPGAGWREALDFEGSRYVGRIAHILDGLPLADMAPNWQVTLGRRGLLVPGALYIGYTDEGGPLLLFGEQVPRRYRVVDPRSGQVVGNGVRASPDDPIPDTGGGPRVYICCDAE